MIVDTHVHVGIWSGGNCSVEDVIANTSAAGVARFVQVTNSNAGWNNGPSLACADEHKDKVLGVVGRFEPSAPDVQGRLQDYMSHGRMIGIRVQPKPPNPEWLRTGIFDPTIAAAEKLGVPIAMFAPYEVPLMHEKVRRFREARFLIDHMGLTAKEKLDEAGTFAQWPELLKLAAEPNVWIKVSHFPQAAANFERFPFPTAQRYLQRLYEHVGARKLIWGSNFPSVGQVCTYRQAVDFIRVHCDFLSEADRRAILGANFLEQFVPARLQPSAQPS